MKLLLDMNHLTGSITAVWNTQKLQILDLNQNQFTGNLPEGISSLRSLQELDLSQNNLTGPLPASYGKLSNLSILSRLIRCTKTDLKTILYQRAGQD